MFCFLFVFIALQALQNVKAAVIMMLINFLGIFTKGECAVNKYIEKTLEFTGFILGYGLNVLILLALVSSVYYFTMKAYALGSEFSKKSDEERPYEEITLVFEDETELADAAKILQENGLVYNAYLYQFENFLKGNREPYAAGTYELNTQMDSSEINRALRSVVTQTVQLKITIPEGRNIKEIARYLETEGIIGADEFLEVANTVDFQYDFLRDIPADRENRLEGYLFPDTYFVSENPAATEIIDKMLYRFWEMYDWECAVRAEELGLTTDEVITIASIIEKEIKRAEERELAASVIYNRLSADMKLQMCSTIIYVLEKNKDRLLDEDLEVPSPYNTYINAGLPVGPIGNPGKLCIEAALFPADTGYLYFVVKDEETGEHVFTGDYDEFLNAKVEYNQRF